MKIVFAGCVEFSYSVLAHLLLDKKCDIAGVITRRASSFNADFRSLELLAAQAGIPCFFDTGNNQDDMARWLGEIAPDVVYCFGWSSLLKKEILAIPRLGVVGYHPTALPQNRGRHPIIWALALGLSETASTFFFMDEGADSGDILSQVAVEISPSDDAASLYGKLVHAALRQVTTFTAQLASGAYPHIPQDHSRASYWRKRTKSDGRIDWRMSSHSINNLVRALTRPYVGAHCEYGNNEIKIWKAEQAAPVLSGTERTEPGKVLKVQGRTFLIKCGEGVLRIREHEFDAMPQEGEYL